MWVHMQRVVRLLEMTYMSMRDAVTWSSLCACTVTVGATWISYVWLIRPFISPLRQIPGLAFNPIYGNMRTMLTGDNMELSLKMIAKCGKIVRYYFFLGSERILVADADMIRHILVTNSRNYIKPATRMVLMKKVLGDGLVLQEGATHAAHKRLMSPAFNQAAIRRMVKTFVGYACDLSAIWYERIENRPRAEDWGVLNVHADLTRLTLDIIGRTAFGHEFNCLHEPDMEVTSAFNRLLSDTELNWRMVVPFYYSFNIFPAVRRFNKDVAIMKTTIRNIIRLKRQKQAEGKGIGEDGEVVLDTIMKARDDTTGAALTDQELEDEVMTLMAAGHETTSVAMAWALLALAQNQDIQQRVRDEVQQNVTSSDARDVTVEHLDQMHYLGCVIKETLRLYPPITMTFRQPVADDHLGPYLIPKGTILLLHLGCLMRLPEYWDDPLTFKPERFLLEESGGTPNTFLPFLIGHRMCLGYRFALIEMKAVLATLVRNFRFEVIPNLTFKRKQLITMRPDPPLRLRVSLINQPLTS